MDRALSGQVCCWPAITLLCCTGHGKAVRGLIVCTKIERAALASVGMHLACMYSELYPVRMVAGVAQNASQELIVGGVKSCYLYFAYTYAT